MSHVAIIGSESELGRQLAAHYAAAGHTVSELPLARATPPAPPDLAAAGESIDLAIFVDGFVAAAGPAATATRAELRRALRRLTFLPFETAVRLHPALARSRGRAALLSRREATMSAGDPLGHYLDRPFRAAAHALWRCLAVEWRGSGVECVLVAVPPDVDAADLAAAIERAPNGELVDIDGTSIGW